MTFQNYEWNPNFDVISYNSLVGGLIIVFQTFTLSNWSDLMYMTIDVAGFIAVPYFVTLVLIGSFLMPNMLIAILKAKYIATTKLSMDEAQKRQDELEGRKISARQRWRKSIRTVKVANTFGFLRLQKGRVTEMLQTFQEKKMSVKQLGASTGRIMNGEKQKKFVSSLVRVSDDSETAQHRKAWQ